MSALFPYGRPFGPGHKINCPCNYCAMPNGAPPRVFLPLMTRPSRNVERESAETYMRQLLERTLAELRRPKNG